MTGGCAARRYPENDNARLQTGAGRVRASKPATGQMLVYPARNGNPVLRYLLNVGSLNRLEGGNSGSRSPLTSIASLP